MASRVEATGMRDTSPPYHRLDLDDGQKIYRHTAPPNRISGQDTVSAHLGTQECQGWRFPLRGTRDRPLVSTTRNIDIPPVKTPCALPFGQFGAGVQRRVCRMAGKPQGAIFPSIRDKTGLLSQRAQPNHPPFPFCRPNRIGDFVPTCSAPAKNSPAPPAPDYLTVTVGIIPGFRNRLAADDAVQHDAFNPALSRTPWMLKPSLK